MKRVHKILAISCLECEARKLHPRFGDFFAYAERQRRQDESLLDSMNRIAVDLAVSVHGENPEALADVLSLGRTSGYRMLNARKAEREAARFRKEQIA